jgi:hypothetical protein
MESNNYLDATTFTIAQIVTLNDKYKGVLKNTLSEIFFDVEFKDPCWDGAIELQNNAG